MVVPHRGAEPRLVKLEDFIKPLDLPPAFSEGIAKCDKVTIYEGLPHQMFEAKTLKQELATKETVKKGGFPFYAQPVVISAAAQAKLKKLYLAPKTFMTLTEPFMKACGGFHPDWAIEWSHGAETWLVLVCFGCSETITWHGNTKFLADFHASEKSEEKFRALLDPLHKQRPNRSPK